MIRVRSYSVIDHEGRAGLATYLEVRPVPVLLVGGAAACWWHSSPLLCLAFGLGYVVSESWAWSVFPLSGGPVLSVPLRKRTEPE